MLSDEQLAIRRKGITATDIGKIVGLSPYGCALDVKMDKQGVGLPFIEHERVKWGNLLEQPIRDDYADRHGVIVVEGDTIQHPTEPWALATPDAMIYSSLDRELRLGLEIKTHTQWLSHLYGEPGSDDVPIWELTQCAWNIWVCSAFYGVQIERWDLTVFLDGLPTDYTILRDVELENVLIKAARAFWTNYVIGNADVPPDGSGHYDDILKARWKRNDPESLVEVSGDEVVTIHQLKCARTASKDAEIEVNRLTQEVKMMIGEASTLEWTENDKKHRINWKLSKDGQKVNYKNVSIQLRALIEDMLPYVPVKNIPDIIQSLEPDDLALAMDEITEMNTKTTAGSRRFTVPRAWSAK